MTDIVILFLTSGEGSDGAVPTVLPAGRSRGGGTAAAGGLLLAEAECQLDDSAGNSW